MIADTQSLISVAAGGSPISPVSAQGLAVQIIVDWYVILSPCPNPISPYKSKTNAPSCIFRYNNLNFPSITNITARLRRNRF